METTGVIPLILLYIVLPLLILGAVMYIIRKKNDKAAGRSPSKKFDSLKAEERKGERKS